MSAAIERAVAAGLHGYARALDERDWPRIADLFAEDAIARYGADDERRGSAAIVAAIRHYLDGCGPTQHMIGNIEVSTRGGIIASRSYVRAVHRARDEDVLLWSFGEYHARWVRQGRQLRIAEWEMRVAFNHGDPRVFGH